MGSRETARFNALLGKPSSALQVLEFVRMNSDLKEEDKEGGRLIGGYLLFTKPYDIKELIATIKKLMGEKASVA